MPFLVFLDVFSTFLSKYTAEVFGCIFVLVLLVFIMSLTALIKSSNTKRKMNMLLRDNKGTDITNAIINYYEKCRNIEENFKFYEEKIDNLEKETKLSVKKVGTLRYDAYGENNSNLSFVVAMLDDDDTGFVLNGVFTRGQTASYLKAIKNGSSVFALSDEEKEAIKIAKENYDRKLMNTIKE